jgi:drug/metabolite transporter (DMT)-like permease
VGLALAGAVSAGSVIVIIRKLAQKLHWSAVLLYQALGQVLLT